MSKKNKKQENRVRPAGPPREFVSMMEFGEGPRIGAFATLGEVLVDAVQMIKDDGDLRSRFGKISLEDVRLHPEKYMKEIRSYFGADGRAGESMMTVYHPDVGEISYDDLLRFAKLEKLNPQLEIEHNLVVSTWHITKKDAGLLEADAEYKKAEVTQGPNLIVYRYEEGFFVYCAPPSGDEEFTEQYDQQVKERGYSKALIELIQVTRRHGCKFLHLDSDGEVYDIFPTFDW
jgi:hypothetical protein